MLVRNQANQKPAIAAMSDYEAISEIHIWLDRAPRSQSARRHGSATGPQLGCMSMLTKERAENNVVNL